MEKKAVVTRMKRIEGQVRGITKMLDEDRYCADVLLQISAARAALKKVALGIMESHVKGCIVRAFNEEREEEAIEELLTILDKFAR